ncbi:unnamed protein product [Lactuca virosa]|uniref:Uncharacterized protein n=1 Tax=Lactuca virosa TaxID=75947 RepID=A0AAU9LSX0_9ASTR|nr:unnamed protein product [Lactuca virosa]CAH1434474.1 unnamed protein product [Lactuca virosa]
MKKYYYSEEGIESKKDKWREIYYSTMKEEVAHEEEEESSEVSESESESKPPPQFPLATLPPKQLTPPLPPSPQLPPSSSQTHPFPPPTLMTSTRSSPSSGYENRRDGAMINLGG